MPITFTEHMTVITVPDWEVAQWDKSISIAILVSNVRKHSCAHISKADQDMMKKTMIVRKVSTINSNKRDVTSRRKPHQDHPHQNNTLVRCFSATSSKRSDENQHGGTDR